VAQTIVDNLESIEIEIEHRKRTPDRAQAGFGKPAPETLDEHRAV
jgi:hypothetical protein